MHDFKNLVAVSVLTLLLVAGVVTAALCNPYVLLGLAPVLLAIAAIVRAVTAGRRDDDQRDDPRDGDHRDDDHRDDDHCHRG